ncbi:MULTISPECIES: terminase TerL endonuclease subunit [Rhodopseudomonas]|uniref:Terminase n=1 Tax=Rhodopseudomonas palustris TaxID=1076 RepID=A0A0D7EQJ9_RHOPL|nr:MULTISPECIES: terminase TerL endonuclease subunit [Rhodopseudomonas]KIZ43104.1 terminase [Rhodopseudomonas palustris]MDF3810689.1 terminase large subunit [Rhodopseudomonas sp. BAL398]WOK20587.1 terminase large subunit [Rhodopseudomonas sp. BAL398]
MKTTYPFWIDDDSEIPDTFGDGEKAIRFLRNLRHPKSTAPGRAFQLDRWMERIIRRIYGPRHPDGTRIVKTVFAMIPRGNRKTTLGAALTLLHTIGPEKVQGGQVICAAADQKQARIAFEEAVGVIREDPRLARLVKIEDYRNRFRDIRSGSLVEAISADAKTQHGRTPNFTLMDELHAWPKRDLWEALKTGLLKAKGSLNVIITTAGRGQESIAYDRYSYARKVALGEIDDPATLPILFEAPADCDWRDETIWHRVNPGLKFGYPDLEGVRQFARESENSPGDRESFRKLNLNIWLDHSTNPFVDMATYDHGSAPIDFEALLGKPCWVGVDMSTTTDLTAVVACFRDDDRFVVVPHFFCPADNLRARSERDGVPYVQWGMDRFITPTAGNVIDYRAVELCIRDHCERYDVREIAFDVAYAQGVMAPLQEAGLPVMTMRQGWVTQSPALNELERAIVGRNFQHGGHPVLRWCFSNIAIHTDGAGNRTMHKGKSTDRIDGASATWMALARAAAGEDQRSFYSNPAVTPEMLIWN